MIAGVSLSERYLRLVLARLGEVEDERLRGIRESVEDLLERGVPGDLIAIGSPLGTTAVFARAVLAANKVFDRWVWLGSPLHSALEFEDEREALRACDLLDDQVHFVENPVSDELQTAPIERLALVLLGAGVGALAEELLADLYPRLTVGGFVLVDEYDASVDCRKAIKQFRRTRAVASAMQPFGLGGVLWRKERI